MVESRLNIQNYGDFLNASAGAFHSEENHLDDRLDGTVSKAPNGGSGETRWR